MAMAIMDKRSILIRDVYIPESLINTFTKVGPSTYEKVVETEFSYGKIYIRIFIYPGVEKRNGYVLSDVQAVVEAAEFNPVSLLKYLNALQTEIKILR